MLGAHTLRRVVGWLAIVAAVSIVAFGAVTARGRGGRRIVLGVSKLRISLPVFVALEQGLFRDHGLDVDVRFYDTAQPMMDDVALGHIDAGGFVAYPIVFLASRRASAPVRVAGSIVEDASHRLSYVLARAGSGLRFPRDAGGRRIGILPTVAYRRWLIALLEHAAVDPASVTIVPVEPALEAQTLREGGVDMLFTNDPMATAMIARGVAEIADDGPPCARALGDPFAFGTFALSGTFAERDPALAARLVAALDDAIERVREDPSAARRAMANFIRADERPFVERYPLSRYLDARETGAAWLDAEIAREHRFGVLDRDPQVRPWLPTAER
jgi:NitT/TauT family transport system substrate-binding protein